MIKLALVSGSWPPEACGVGDYSAKLAHALVESGVDVTSVGKQSLSLKRISRITFAEDCDVVHVQYPTMGYGRSFAPALIPILQRRKKVVVTIHEFSNFNIIRRPWFLTFAHSVDARIFTNLREMNAFRDAMRPKSGQDYVIPIASNIKKGDKAKVVGSVCNFGLITPNKGIEEFISLAVMCRSLRHFSFSLVGATTGMYKAYADSIIRRCKAEGISLYIDLSEEELANVLSTFQFAYLPFPDGASPKRGSILAAQQNDILVITTHTGITTKGLEESTVHTSSPDVAKRKLINLIENQGKRDDLLHKMRLHRTPEWSDIASHHLDVYKSLVRSA